MDNLEFNITTLRVLLGSCLSEINGLMPLWCYSVLIPEVKISSLSTMLFLTLD